MTKFSQNYKRTFKELEAVASKFWPSELSEEEANLSVVPLLLETQEKFISILSVPTKDLENLFTVIESSTISLKLFLKHLVILADFGGEMLQRISREFSLLFPEGKLNYIWNNEEKFYQFKTYDAKTNCQKPQFSNTTLKISNKDLFEQQEEISKQRKILRTESITKNLQKDAIALLLFGSAYSDSDREVAVTLNKCEIGNYLGKIDELNNYIKQRYIYVSRITGGAKSNSLGQLAQQFVSQYIKDNAKIEGIEVKSGRLPNVTHTDSTTGRLTSFDIVVTNQKKYVAIEVSFQVTTNSVIERKAGQAKSRYEQIEKAQHKIAYVIDGSGNFTRDSALKTICSYSHCTVAFSRNELAILCQFLKEFFADT